MTQKQITIYTLDYCPYCKRAKMFLDEHNIKYNEISCDDNEKEMRIKLMDEFKLGKLATFPQIVVNNQYIGGYGDLIEKYNSSELILD